MNPYIYKDIQRIAKSLPKFQKKTSDGKLMFTTKQERVLGKDLPKDFKSLVQEEEY